LNRRAAAQGVTFTSGTPETLFQTHIAQGAFRQQYDVAPDGRFLINTELEEASAEPIHLLLNWQTIAHAATSAANQFSPGTFVWTGAHGVRSVNRAAVAKCRTC
jgi:hypothetical protein